MTSRQLDEEAVFHVARGISDSDLNAAAAQAARGWVYQPATRGGVAVKVWKFEKITFGPWKTVKNASNASGLRWPAGGRPATHGTGHDSRPSLRVGSHFPLRRPDPFGRWGDARGIRIGKDGSQRNPGEQ